MQTDLRYVFHVYGFITVVEADLKLAIVCLSDEFRCQILDAVMGFKEMDIDGPAGIADEILVLLEDPVQARRRYFQEIIVTDCRLFRSSALCPQHRPDVRTRRGLQGEYKRDQRLF